MKVLIVDFWSDGNIGDAIMQCEILEQSLDVSNDIHVISCFGYNQFQLNAFNESLQFDNVTWHPSSFDTFIKLDHFTEKQNTGRVFRLFRTFLSLFMANLRNSLYSITKNRLFLGKLSYLKEEKFDAIIFNGRNYRDFNSYLKNYINNQPLLINQVFINNLFPDTPKLNAGFSTWGLDASVKKFIASTWRHYTDNVAREKFSLAYMNDNFDFDVTYKKDLSFDYLSSRTNITYKKVKKIAFSLTAVSDIDGYIKQVNNVLMYFYDKGYEIVLIEQVYLAHENVDYLKKLINVPFLNLSSKKISNILSFYKECELVLSTRMHGSIMALSQGCRVASIAYDDGAKWCILKDDIHQYPIFIPVKSSSDDIISYLESEASILHSHSFVKKIESGQQKYVSQFLRNINT